VKIGTGEGCYARASIFYDFGAFGELAMSPRFSCVRSGHLNTTDGVSNYIHATRDIRGDNVLV
jgi:hypothetical protein